MTREEAEKLIGRKVYAWTALHGTYHGILRGVVGRPGRPWRANVEITEALEAPFGGKRGYGPGTVINVGHSSIRLIG